MAAIDCRAGRACCHHPDVAGSAAREARALVGTASHRWELGAPHRSRARALPPVASKGFGAPGGKKGKKQGKVPLRFKQTPAMKVDPDKGWEEMGTVDGFKGKNTQSVILDSGVAFVLYTVDGTVYCSDANSTAFKFPLSDAKIVKGDGGPAVECPLDGTTYDLATGKFPFHWFAGAGMVPPKQPRKILIR
eukprot:evm.model.scf_161.13 EVM.evm.TU.scf_161.13   scf_161:124603-128203(-)